MEVRYSQSFETDIGRIDEVIVIERCEVVIDENTKVNYNPQIVYHDNLLKICLVGVNEKTCNRLIFYYGKGEAFRIVGEGIVLNPERTLFELSIPYENHGATIECPWNTEDTEILESIGPDLGSSLYKDIPVSSDSLVWKESIGKYIVDKGCQDNPSYDVELLDTKSGNLEERPILFKSYQNIKIDQGNWDIDMVKESSLKKQEVYNNISNESFLVWDSPMIDAKVKLEVEPECIDNIGNYLDPGKVVYGNTDCFQFINYPTSLKGFRLTGTSGSEVDILFNKEYTGGNYTSFRCVIGEEGSAEVRISDDLPYYHFNGVVSVGPSRIIKIETIEYAEEWVDEYVPNPDKTYNIDLRRDTYADIPIVGTADYIQYRKYLGEVTEVGRGTDNIDTIPGLIIKRIKNNGSAFGIDQLRKVIICGKSASGFTGTPSALFQVSITNNIEVNGNILSSSTLYADYKIYIVRNPAIWKIDTVPDFTNPEYKSSSDLDYTNVPIFTISWEEGSSRVIRVITNEDIPVPEDGLIEFSLEIENESFYSWDDTYIDLGIKQGNRQVSSYGGREYIDGEWWTVFNVKMVAKRNNESLPLTWQPKTSNGDPRLVTFRYTTLSGENKRVSPVFHPIQRAKTDRGIEIWEELTPGKFSKAIEKITLYNSMTKNFIVAKKLKPEDPTPETKINWYYYDIDSTNRFYITDTNYNLIDSGIEYYVHEDEEVVDLGTIDNRKTYGRVINANRSDVVGDLGILLATETATFPNSWEDLININTASVLVTRKLDNFYIKVGTTEDNMKNEDLVIEVDRIKKLDLWVCANCKYVMQASGYLKIYPDNYEEYSDNDIIPLDQFITTKNVFSGYNSNKYFPLALIRLDLEPGMDESVIELSSGNLVRRVTLKVVGPSPTPHDYYPESTKPNIIKIFNNSGVTTRTNINYTSSTTPSIDYIDINKVSKETTIPNFSKIDYVYHNSDVPFSIKNSRGIGQTKYPIEPFGIIRESSLDYSSIEDSPLDFPLYMKGKEHCLWAVNNLYGLSGVKEPEFIQYIPGGILFANTNKDIYLDASGESGEDFYVVSRYEIKYNTFLTETPEKNKYTIERNGLSSEIKISAQQKITLDEKSQIEYAIPISVKSNVNNNGGCVFLGSLDYKAITEITDDSIGYVIDVSEDIIEAEGIDAEYIKSYITEDKVQNLKIRIFQNGNGTNIFRLLSVIPDIGVDAKSVYMIPEISKDIELTNLRYDYTIKEGDTEIIQGSETTKICDFNAEFSPKYFLIDVNSLDRVSDKSDWHWYGIEFSSPDQTVIPVGERYDVADGDLPRRVINDTHYTVTTTVSKSGSSDSVILTCNFKKYGHHYGFYIEGHAGFGNYKSEILTDSLDPDNDIMDPEKAIYLPSEGGNVVLHAGVFYAIDGFYRTEALMVPKTYEFIGENIPEKVLWEDGNLDGDGNLILTIPPRIREDYGLKKFILHITQPHEYYPLNLYVTLCQKPYYPGPSSYKLSFLKNEINIYSSGKVYGDDKIYFTHNLDHEIFDKVSFGWEAQYENEIPTYPDNLTNVFEIERSYEEGYVRLKFLPNGSRTFIKAFIIAKFNDQVIGRVPANQGYYGLYLTFENPWMEQKDNPGDVPTNYLSRLSPKPLRLYISGYENNEPVYVYINNRGPCKTNADNSEATLSYCGGRGVFVISNIVRKEFYDNSERSFYADVVDSIDLISLSPSTYLESDNSKVSFSLKGDRDIEGGKDHDALIVPRYNTNVPGSNYITDYNFNSSYVEFEYEVKKDYIREELTLSEVCKINLKDIDLNGLAEFFMSTITIKRQSDEIDPFVFKDYTLRYGCEGGTQQTAHNPSYYNIIEIVHLDDGDWSSPAYTSGNNYIEFTTTENKTDDSGEEAIIAYFRTSQYRVDVYDPRSPSVYLLGSYYVTIEQEPDEQEVAEPEPEPPTPTPKPKIKVRFISNILEGSFGEEERDDKLLLNGQIEFYVASPKVSGEYVLVRANLPDYVYNDNKWNLEPYDGSDLPTPPIPPYDPDVVGSKSYYSKVYEVEPTSASPSVTIEELFGQTIDKFPTWKKEEDAESRDKGGRAYTWVNGRVNNRYYYPYIVIRQDQDPDDDTCLFEEDKLYNIIFLMTEDQEPYYPLPSAD